MHINPAFNPPAPAEPSRETCGTCGFNDGGTIREHESDCRYYDSIVTARQFDLDGNCPYCYPQRKPCPDCNGGAS